MVGCFNSRPFVGAEKFGCQTRRPIYWTSIAHDQNPHWAAARPPSFGGQVDETTQASGEAGTASRSSRKPLATSKCTGPSQRNRGRTVGKKRVHMTPNWPVASSASHQHQFLRWSQHSPAGLPGLGTQWDKMLVLVAESPGCSSLSHRIYSRPENRNYN